MKLRRAGLEDSEYVAFSAIVRISMGRREVNKIKIGGPQSEAVFRIDV